SRAKPARTSSACSIFPAARSHMPYNRRNFLLAVAGLFAVGCSLEVLAQKPASELAVAVANDRTAEVRAMLAKGADPNALDENGEPVLILAARGGHAHTRDAL